jgi:hypothetical protein
MRPPGALSIPATSKISFRSFLTVNNMAPIKVSPEVADHINKLKAKIARLEAENAQLRAEAEASIELSDAAPVRGKGRPAVDTYAKKTTTIQATAKIWKLLILVGGLGLLIGFFMVIGGMSAKKEAMAGFGLITTILSFVSLVVGRLGRFWFHG